MTPEQLAADARRAALALIAAAADRDDQAADALLGPGWQADPARHAAVILARWHVTGIRRLGWPDAAWIAREIIADSIADEAEGAGP